MEATYSFLYWEANNQILSLSLSLKKQEVLFFMVVKESNWAIRAVWAGIKGSEMTQLSESGSLRYM